MATLKEEILAAKRRVKAVQVPELNGLTVYVRAMTGTEDEIYQAALETAAESTPKTSVGLVPLLMSLALCDKNGQRLFETAEEAAALDIKALARLTPVALCMSGRTQEFRDELEKKVPAESKDAGSALPKN